MFGPKTHCVVVVGAQWGDEGKGKIVDVLAERADLVVRYQGGANAGHTVDTGAGEFVLHQIPSGIIQGAVCVVGNGVVLDPETFFTELDALTSRGVRTEHKLYVSDRAHLTLPYHKLLDRAREQREKIGTTGRGIGPTYEDKYGRRGVRVGDLRNLDRAKELVCTRVRAANEFLELLGSHERADPGEHVGLLDRLAPRLLPTAVDAGRVAYEALQRGQVVVRYAVRVNGLTGLAVTKLDVLDSFSHIPVCVGYRLDGEPCDSMPAEVERLTRVEPAYETLPGWQKSLSHVRRLADLPPPARAYLDRLQDLAHAPIQYVSVRTRRDQIIELT